MKKNRLFAALPLSVALLCVGCQEEKITVSFNALLSENLIELVTPVAELSWNGRTIRRDTLQAADFSRYTPSTPYGSIDDMAEWVQSKAFSYISDEGSGTAQFVVSYTLREDGNPSEYEPAPTGHGICYRYDSGKSESISEGAPATTIYDIEAYLQRMVSKADTVEITFGSDGSITTRKKSHL